MEINEYMRNQARAHSDEVEKRLLEFFGSFEHAGTYAKDYILEADIVENPSKRRVNLDEGYTYHLEVVYRLRPKTEDEKRHDRAEEILKRNSTQGVCISCNEPIMGNEKLIHTIHGDYHGAPKNCVEGRYNA